jgi:hypothetical protein
MTTKVMPIERISNSRSFQSSLKYEKDIKPRFKPAEVTDDDVPGVSVYKKSLLDVIV